MDSGPDRKFWEGIAKMSESLFERIRKTVIAGAQTSATKIEEAARVGKLHLDMMAEKRKLNREYTELGKEAYMALLENHISQFATRPGVAGIQAAIDLSQKNIAALEIKIAQASQQGSSKEDGSKESTSQDGASKESH